jgi:hypothetical protein
MPDLTRLLSASAAAVLLAAIAGGQQTSPFRQPPIMPPELAPETPITIKPNVAVTRLPHPILSGQFQVELDNAQMRVMRFTVPQAQRFWLPLDETAPGILVVALADSDITIQHLSGTEKVRMAAGTTRWIEGSWVSIQNWSGQPRRFLAVESKQ